MRPLLRFVWPFAVTALSVAAALLQGLEFAFFLLLVLLVATMLYQLPDLLKFSIGPLSAEFREKVAEAEQILARLKRQSGVLAHPLLDVLGWSNRMGMMSARKRQALMLSVKQELRSHGYSEDEMRPMMTEYIRLVGMDYSRFILGSRHPKSASEVQIAQWQKLRAPVEPQSPQSLREFLVMIDAATDRTEKLLSDYEAFLATGVSHDELFLDSNEDRIRYQLVAGEGLVPTTA